MGSLSCSRRCCMRRPYGRHDVTLHRVVEAFAVSRRIVEPQLGLEHVIAERAEPRVPCDLLPERVHAVEQGREIRPRVHVWRRARAERALAHIPVGLFQEGCQLRQGQLLPVPGRRHASRDALVRGRLLLEFAHDRHVHIAENLDGGSEAPQRGLQRRRRVPRGYEPLLQRNAPFLGLRQDLHGEPEVVGLRFLVPGVDCVADHRAAGGLGEHRLETRPVGEPLLHPGVVQLPCRESIEMRADVIPGSLREGLGRGGQCQRHAFSVSVRACR